MAVYGLDVGDDQFTDFNLLDLLVEIFLLEMQGQFGGFGQFGLDAVEKQNRGIGGESVGIELFDEFFEILDHLVTEHTDQHAVIRLDLVDLPYEKGEEFLRFVLLVGNG